MSVATDGGRQEGWDWVTYQKFGELADGYGNGVWGKGKGGNECGIKRELLKGYFDSDIKDVCRFLIPRRPSLFVSFPFFSSYPSFWT